MKVPTKEQVAVCYQAWEVARTLDSGRVVVVVRGIENPDSLGFFHTTYEGILPFDSEVMRIHSDGRINFYERAFIPKVIRATADK
jgi:hypothetical protein